MASAQMSWATKEVPQIKAARMGKHHLTKLIVFHGGSFLFTLSLVMLLPSSGIDVPFEFFFRAGEKPLDIAPVAPDHQSRHRAQTETGVQPVVAHQTKNTVHRHAGRGGDGAQGDISGGEPQQPRTAPQAISGHPPVQQQHQHAAGEDALAAPQAEEHREHVPQLAADACNQQAQGPVTQLPQCIRYPPMRQASTVLPMSQTMTHRAYRAP